MLKCLASEHRVWKYRRIFVRRWVVELPIFFRSSKEAKFLFRGTCRHPSICSISIYFNHNYRYIFIHLVNYFLHLAAFAREIDTLDGKNIDSIQRFLWHLYYHCPILGAPNDYGREKNCCGQEQKGQAPCLLHRVWSDLSVAIFPSIAIRFYSHWIILPLRMWTKGKGCVYLINPAEMENAIFSPTAKGGKSSLFSYPTFSRRK